MLHQYISSLLSFLFISLAVVSATPISSPLQPRDNACTACRIVLTDARKIHPASIYDCASTNEQRVEAFNIQVCNTYNGLTAPGFVINYCHALVQQYGTEQGGLFEAVASTEDPADLCHEQFAFC